MNKDAELMCTMDGSLFWILGPGAIMDGMYAMYYTGRASCGHALLSMKNGLIAGADSVGGILDGTYVEDEDGDIDVSLTLKSLPGTGLVTGELVQENDLSQIIEAKLPHYFWNGNSIGIRTPTGPINVVFKRLRETM